MTLKALLHTRESQQLEVQNAVAVALIRERPDEGGLLPLLSWVAGGSPDPKVRLGKGDSGRGWPVCCKLPGNSPDESYAHVWLVLQPQRCRSPAGYIVSVDPRPRAERGFKGCYFGQSLGTHGAQCSFRYFLSRPLSSRRLGAGGGAALLRINVLSLVYLLVLLLLPWLPGPTRHSVPGVYPQPASPASWSSRRAVWLSSFGLLICEMAAVDLPRHRSHGRLATPPGLTLSTGRTHLQWPARVPPCSSLPLHGWTGHARKSPRTAFRVRRRTGCVLPSGRLWLRTLCAPVSRGPATWTVPGAPVSRDPDVNCSRKPPCLLASDMDCSSSAQFPPPPLAAALALRLSIHVTGVGGLAPCPSPSLRPDLPASTPTSPRGLGRLAPSDTEEVEGDGEPPAGPQEASAAGPRRRLWLAPRFWITAHWLLVAAGRMLAITLLALAGIAQPSAFSSVYLLLFLAVCTWWACHFPISPLGFSALCVMVSCFSAGHLLCLYCYQMPIAQALLPPDDLCARLFGLKDFVGPTNCSSPNALVLNTSHDWPDYVSPGILLLLYYTVTSLLKLRRRRPLDQRKEVASEDEQHELELDQLERGTQGQPGAAAGDGEATQCPVPTSTGPDTSNCIVHDLTGQSPIRQRPVHPRLAQPRETSPLHGLGHLIMNQSYVCALIAMMVWSITYHSWLTFVLLLWACLIWTVRSRQQLAMLCAPFLLLYGLTLCCLRYVWAMKLRPELPTTLGPVSLHQLGLQDTRYPCLDLGAMLLYMLTFWLLLRQFVKEKLLKRAKPAAALLEVTVADTEPTRMQILLRSLGELVTGIYAKYWIYVCAGMFIVVSFAGRLVVYKIVYMFLFLLCLTLFQVYYSLWRKLLRVFWWLVVAYTMLVLIAVYTFQFQDFPAYWRNLTGFTDEQLGDLGLEQFSVSELFSSILIPGFFLLACILQLHYFHRPFMQLTDLEHVSPPGTRRARWARRQDTVSETPLLQQEEELAFREDGPLHTSQAAEGSVSKWGLVAERLLDLAASFSDVLSRVQVFVRRLLELHVFKLVALYTVWVALREVSVMNLLLVVLWAFATPYPRFRPMASCLSTVWTCIIIVCKMLYQLKVVNPHEYSSNCSQPLPNSTNLLAVEIKQSLLYRGPVDPANWFGVRKGFPNLGYIQNHLQVLLLLVFEAMVYRRQEHYRRQHQQVPLPAQAVCADGSRQQLDQDLLSCLKYFINFFFYKFGLEICFLMSVNVIGQRMDFMVILHGCWLVTILTRRRRGAIARLWPNYCLFLTLFLLYQYLLCLGMPPALCVDYPWRWSQAIPMNSALIKWLYLPDFFRAPNSTNLISDFLLLLCASQQWQVFAAERTEEWRGMAGRNTDQLPLLQGEPNPVPNFIHCRSYLDMLKVAVFRYLFWFVLVVVFVTGATRISIFGMGYLLACFYLLLFGTALLQKDTRAQLVLWDCLILYNVTVIISKNMLSLLSCVFVEQMQSAFCWVIQLFSLVCTVKGYYDPKEVMGRDKDCLLPVEEAGIIWDSVCFFFLLLQRRVFLSHYFQHVSVDLQATALQASRGFALYNAANLKSIDFHRKTEEKSLAQLKRQMKRIRAKQEKYRQGRAGRGRPRSPEAEEPYQEPGPVSPGGSSLPRRQWWRPWLDHATVIHSGDYFLFESDSEEEEEAPPEDPRPSAQSAFQMAYQAWVTNARTVLRQRQERAGHLPAGGSPSQEEQPAEALEDEAAGRSHMLQRLLNTLQFLWVLGQATVDGLTRWLLAFTRHHHTMSDVLRAERYLLTQELLRGGEVHLGVLDQLYIEEAETVLEGRDGPSAASSGLGPEEPLSSMTDDTGSPLSTGYNSRSGSEEIVSDTGDPEAGGPLQGSQELLAHAHTRTRTASELLLDRRLHIPELEEAEQFEATQGRTLQLLRALYQCVAAHSELLCYFIIILNHTVTASAVSLVLPVLVFLWAMLTIPRPSKRFWMTAIVFTEVVVVAKYLFQFGFFPWNSHTVLRRHESKPFFPPRILGLEKMDGYIKYDLAQLMALFFHRSQLLCYGLWDHEEHPLSKEHSRSRGQGPGAEERPAAPPGPQAEVGTEYPEGPGLPAATANIQGEASIGAKDGSPQAELRAQDSRHPSLRFRGRQESPAVESDDREEEERTQDTGRKQPSLCRERMKAAGRRLQSFCLNLAQSVSQPLRQFFHDILHTKYRAATDVYVLMFLADVVDFIIIIFGFWAFGKHSAATDITSSLSDNQVPEAFLVMLLIQFSTMVIDRALYLRKTVLGKLAFQVVLVLAIHLWMFFILPAVTERMFRQNAVAQLWYFVKCIYFALSAYQIRCGYPTRILGNFLTKKYNHVNLFLFQGFRLVPFLVELRAVMDWVWTDTTLSLSNWMCVEDIYANIFIIKCSRETEKKYPQPKGQKKKKIVKYGMGGLIIIFLIAIIWFPLLFMSLVRSVVGVVNQPIDVTVTLKLGGYEPLFTMSAQQPSIVPFTPQAYEELCRQFDAHPLAMQFISQYSPEDIVTAQIEGSSGALWRISPPSRDQMRRELYNGTADITLRFTWNFQRDLAKGGSVEYTNEKHTLELAPNSTERQQLARLLDGTSDHSVVIPHLFPKYIRAPNGPEANPVKQLQPMEEADYLGVRIQLWRERGGAGAAGFLEWWVIEMQDCHSNCNLLPMVIFSDKVSPPSLGFLAGYGIMGLYVSIVLVIGKFVRGFFSEISHSIMFEELPCVDRILKLCQDIFLVRETRELELEEELYAKLIFLYRSPETMIKWTREKE
ncbi:PREDICTED: piezo-type mechanosensitive ion channel component 1 [Dipodomys ordii]|uniref:Piezo-type mechanosensitive ion channel component 1 n=1 Tax=Dipodomys ordii TaxID=10020 RepID=A0A1S3EW55_DIPOR|nr:PREDICTED: piezo-type mechanosensitive ion channel component 1 [Dipodomys ordii]